jgi:hypothetical protein
LPNQIIIIIKIIKVKSKKAATGLFRIREKKRLQNYAHNLFLPFTLLLLSTFLPVGELILLRKP